MSFDSDTWSRAAHAYAGAVRRSGRGGSALAGRARWIAVAGCGLLLATAPLAVAGPESGGSDRASASRTGDVIREGIRNPRRGAAARETQVISGVRGERYGTRQSNISTGANAGGAAIYGCRRPTRECTRHVNLRDGPAAHFATAGSVPFTIDPNATGMVAGLNAERVGGLTATQLRGQTGPRGATGATGPKGDKGDKGDPGDPAEPSWELDGNAGTSAGVNFLGTTDDEPFELKVNGERALRLEPLVDSPNLIGGHPDNEVEAGVHGATIGGGGGASGGRNRVTANFGTVGGGEINAANDIFSTVGGGQINAASGDWATVGGGLNNSTSLLGATVGGGLSNAASGALATVAGGEQNTADGTRSFAAGRRAKALHDGAFVWGDNGGFTTDDIESTGEDQFIARARGGFFLWDDSTFDESNDRGHFLDTATGGHLTTGGAWTDTSDRNQKMGFAPIEPASVLARVAELPLSSWEYKAEPGARHLGPTAQDFYRAFGLGSSDKHIASLDSAGVALAAIQRLKEENDELKQTVGELNERLEALEAEL